MGCSETWPVEVVERYVRGELDERSAAAFEDHYFGCTACFAGVRDLQALRGELSRSRRAVEAEAPVLGPVRWAALAAAVLVLGVAGGLWLSRSGPAPSPVSAPSEAPAAVPSASPLADLARVEPPAWTRVRLRGAEDGAARRFRAAMEPYAKGEWGTALPLLREAARSDPGTADVTFYRGACALLAGQTAEAIQSLRAVAALGDTPFLEEARFYLAKAHLAAADLPAAREELRRVLEMNGERREAARDLLLKLDALEGRPP